MQGLAATWRTGHRIPRDEELIQEFTGERGNGRLADCHRVQLKRAVAALSSAAIAEMNRRELVFAVRTAELPWLEGNDHWQQSDRATLERLVCLARETCRTQLSDPESNGGHFPAAEPPIPRSLAR